jgi:hypothetical protein
MNWNERGTLVNPPITHYGFEVNAVASIYWHLSKIVNQRNCPFAPSVQRNNAAYVHVDSQSDSAIESITLSVLKAVLLMAQKFFEISPRETSGGQSTDFTTLFWVFVTLDNSGDPVIAEELSAARVFYAPIALSCGLTLADSGPEHPDPEGDGRNVTPFPTIIMHRLHKVDRLFMQSPVAGEIFRRFFPD